MVGWRQLSQSSESAIIGETLDGTIVAWNKGAEIMYGYTAAEAIGKPIAMLAPPDRADEITDILQRIARGERVSHFERLRVCVGMAAPWIFLSSPYLPLRMMLRK